MRGLGSERVASHWPLGTTTCRALCHAADRTGRSPAWFWPLATTTTRDQLAPFARVRLLCMTGASDGRTLLPCRYVRRTDHHEGAT
jgi:hypothetical protein